VSGGAPRRRFGVHRLTVASVVDALGRTRSRMLQHVVRSRDENIAYLILLAAERNLAAELPSGTIVRFSHITPCVSKFRKTLPWKT
jgi:hypothetical protein